MDRRRVGAIFAILVTLLILTACAEPAAPPVTPTVYAPTSHSVSGSPASPVALAVASPAALACLEVGALPANTPLAARVNGQGIPLDLYNRQVQSTSCPCPARH
ncbi:MAG: hypothetical protein M1570_16780 [Chloroflexi bacterium]|nr:hypothetical protein [Chloroflexota bacterium]